MLTLKVVLLVVAIIESIISFLTFAPSEHLLAAHTFLCALPSRSLERLRLV